MPRAFPCARAWSPTPAVAAIPCCQATCPCPTFPSTAILPPSALRRRSFLAGEHIVQIGGRNTGAEPEPKRDDVRIEATFDELNTR